MSNFVMIRMVSTFAELVLSCNKLITNRYARAGTSEQLVMFLIMKVVS